MKKKLMALIFLGIISCCSICFADAPTKQKLLIFTNKHDEEIAEVDYYLQRGGKILKMEPVQKNPGVVYCYIVLEVPSSVPDYPKPQIKTK